MSFRVLTYHSIRQYQLRAILLVAPADRRRLRVAEALPNLFRRYYSGKKNRKVEKAIAVDSSRISCAKNNRGTRIHAAYRELCQQLEKENDFQNEIPAGYWITKTQFYQIMSGSFHSRDPRRVSRVLRYTNEDPRVAAAIGVERLFDLCCKYVDFPNTLEKSKEIEHLYIKHVIPWLKAMEYNTAIANMNIIITKAKNSIFVHFPRFSEKLCVEMRLQHINFLDISKGQGAYRLFWGDSVLECFRIILFERKRPNDACLFLERLQSNPFIYYAFDICVI